MSTDNQSAQNALLPCPFCGKEPHVRLWTSFYSHAEVEYFQIVCGKCGALSISSEKHDEVIAAWNTRSALAQAPVPSGGAPDGWVLVPKEPTPGLLISMAIRYDHGLGCPGYYDHPLFASDGRGVTHARRLEATIGTMRQLHEEVVGTGFYKPEKEADYAAAAPKGASK